MICYNVAIEVWNGINPKFYISISKEVDPRVIMDDNWLALYLPLYSDMLLPYLALFTKHFYPKYDGDGVMLGNSVGAKPSVD